MIGTDVRTTETRDFETPLKLSTTALLTLIDESFQEYLQKNSFGDYHTFAIDVSTITRYIIYGSFDSFLGASKHVSWTNIYGRVRQYLEKVDAVKIDDSKDWKISPEVRKRIQCVLEGTNCKTTSAIKDSMSLDLSNFIEEQVAYRCAFCKQVFMDRGEVLVHLPAHSLSEFLEYQNNRK